MGYKFLPDRMYRMPTHFGPSAGPRQDEHGGKFANVDAPTCTEWTVSFLTRAEQLEALLPEGYGLALALFLMALYEMHVLTGGDVSTSRIFWQMAWLRNCGR